MIVKQWIVIGVVLVFVGCSHQDTKDWKKADEYQRTRYTQTHDSTPAADSNVQIADAVPKYEEKTRVCIH